MTKPTKHTIKTIRYELKIPGGTVIIGPGTVPTSDQSVQKTVIQKMIQESRKASKEGIFKDEEDPRHESSRAY